MKELKNAKSSETTPAEQDTSKPLRPPWAFDPREVRELPRANYIAWKLPKEEQPRVSVIIEMPDSHMNTLITRFEILNAGPGNLYMNMGTPVEVPPRAKVGEIVTAFENGMVKLEHLGEDVYLLPEMHILYVEPQEGHDGRKDNSGETENTAG